MKVSIIKHLWMLILVSLMLLASCDFPSRHLSVNLASDRNASETTIQILDADYQKVLSIIDDWAQKNSAKKPEYEREPYVIELPASCGLFACSRNKVLFWVHRESSNHVEILFTDGGAITVSKETIELVQSLQDALSAKIGAKAVQIY